MRFGVGVSDHRQARRGRRQLLGDALDAGCDAWLSLGLPFDAYQVCRDALAANWPNAVAVGRRDDREMGSGVAREPNQGFVVHFDDALREFSGNLLDANLVAQFAFNLYLSVPEMGGKTVVWRHRWHPADEAFRLPRSYGYAEAVVGEAESFELKPAVGAALLFNPRNFHAVRPSQDSRRIALGFSVGLSDTGELLTWGGPDRRPMFGNYYATVAQVLPVLLLAFLWDSGFLQRLRDQRRPTRRTDPHGVWFSNT